ncbi:precorrin-3B synthase [Arenibacterium halophilum]|uniref:Precorrin-3B synthase n=1 Tax=Arenibacterium halophilum TaxID=2583821 RepID=A0ABY2XAK0_9RHOB|nr:precorrin-3B synthase [Arenibacterium halophilum]TMV12984.1 precorrin-3B synthase [Arenibacterium halophilum]
MSEPVVKGWCPGAYRPMMSGDGLIVRVRPRLGRLSRAQVLGLCEAAATHSGGIIDLTNRANLQLRGVAEDAHEPLLAQLFALGLVDADPETESRRNLIVAPFWQPGDLIHRIAAELSNRLHELPDLPAKFGFSVDCSVSPLLAGESADIRVERTATGGILVRADGRTAGRAVAPEEAVDTVLALAHWFATNRGEARRMAVVSDQLGEDWAQEFSAPPRPRPDAGPHADGMMVGVPFGSTSAPALAALVEQTGAQAVTVTPWRLLHLPGVAHVRRPGFITEPGDPLLATHACPGAPLCPQGTVATRDLARALAPRVGGGLHVSGCAKGCAYPRPAPRTLVGREGAFDLVREGCSWDEPELRALSPDTLLNRPELL